MGREGCPATMRTSDFDFELPPALIAQIPANQRDESRLLVLHRDSGRIEHSQFKSILDWLRPGDVLVLNDSRVIPARLRAVNAQTGGRFEILLLEENGTNDWWVMMRPGRRARKGTQMKLQDTTLREKGIEATVLEENVEGHRRLIFTGTADILNELSALGAV